MDSDSLINQLLAVRGLDTPAQKEEFFHPESPEKIPLSRVGINESQLNTAIQLIKQHISQNHKIAVYGDYDVDGICSTAILWETLYSQSQQVFPHIPHRKDEGYGLSVAGIDHCLAQGAKLIIAVDNGVVAHEQIEYCKSQGCDIIVIDHHEPSGSLPSPSALIHSTQTCAAALVWFFCREYLGRPDLDHLSLAAIGVVCDIIPLLGFNRSLVKYGLQELRSTRRPGLLALFSQSRIDPAQINTYHIGFIIGPRLNAMGRLEHALDSLRLLCTPNLERAQQLAAHLEDTNRTRQQLTLDSTQHALSLLQTTYGDQLPKLLIVSDASYDQGVIGLIASKLVEKHSRPAIAISIGPTESKASARSVPGFHITEHLRTAADLLAAVGGHAMAAGFTVSTDKLDQLNKFLIDSAETAIDPQLLIKQYRYDAEIPLDIVSRELYLRLQDFAPFGIGNPQPAFLTRQVELASPRRIGKDSQHIKFHAGPYEALLFNHPGDLPPVADLIYSLDINHWNNEERLQLIIKDIKV
jgi:single-stranded-DNA-specific exonuclease